MRAMLVTAVNVPEVPVIVTVAGPVVAELLAASVRTLVPVVGFVPNVAVTPLGSPDAARVTLPENGLTSVTVMVSVPLLPWVTDREDADGFSVKLPDDDEDGGVPVPMMMPRPFVPRYTVPKTCGSPVMVEFAMAYS